MNQKEIILGIDFAFQMRLGFEEGYLYDASCIRRLIRRAAEAGVNTIYWRVSATGRVTYQSKVRAVIGKTAPHIEGFKLCAVENLIVRQADPPAVAVDEARKCGLRIYGYITLFDEYYPGLESDFALANPQFTWKHRLRNHHLPGLLSYAYPEVREHRLAELRELLDYGFDGVYLDTARSHTAIAPVIAMPLTGGDPYLEYGFNDPEVAEFKRRYGVDPRLKDPADAPLVTFDREAWNKLRGEYLTQFLREARVATDSAMADLIVGFYSDGPCYLSPAGRRGRIPMGMFHHDYETWVKENLVDGFVLIADHRRYGNRDWREHSAKQFEPLIRQGKRVYIWAATEARVDELHDSPCPLPASIEKEPEDFFAAMEKGIHACANTSATGVYLYEAYAPEKYAESHRYWERLGGILQPKVAAAAR